MAPSLIQLLLVAALLLVASPARAIDADRPPEQYHVDAWSSEQGLPQNTVHSLLQTRDGYLWVGTQQGLARFDGVRFVVFDRRTAPALEGGLILSLLEDHAGRLWVGTFGAGLLEYKDGTFVAHPVPHQVITSMVEDADGYLWLGTGGGGLIRYRDGQSKVFTTADGLAGDFVRTLAVDPKTRRRVWIGTRTEGLGWYEDGRFGKLAALDPYAEAQIRSVATAPDGTLWVGTGSKGVVHVLADGKVETFGAEQGLPSDLIYVVHPDPSGAIWVGTSSGLGRLRHGRGEAVLRQETEDSTIFTVLEDLEGNLWAGTSIHGLMRLMEGAFVTFTPREGLGSADVLAVHEDRAGTVWAGSVRGGLVKLKPRARTFEREEDFPQQPVCAIYEDRKGALWVGTWNGLYRHDREGWRGFHTADGLPSETVCAFAEHEGGLWLGTNLGLGRYADGKISVPPLTGFPFQQNITMLFETRDGELWVGTQQDGIAAVKGGRVRAISQADGLGSNFVHNVLEDKDGSIWIALLGGGLARYRDGKVFGFHARPGALEETLYSMVDDGNGHLWLCGNRGITQVSKSLLASVAGGEQASIRGRLYTKADGLNLSECNASGAPNAMRSADGRMWFATVGGLAMVDPRTLRSRGRPPPVLIEAMRADRRTVDLGKEVVLAAGTRDLEFDYTGLSLVAPTKVTFEYRLDDYESAWQQAGTRRVAYYSNLPPGTYRFRVRATNQEGQRSIQEATVAFTQRPFFWQTPAFIAFCALGVIVLAGSAYAWRIQFLKRREAALVANNLRLEQALAEAQEAVRLKIELLRESKIKDNLSRYFSPEIVTMISSDEGLRSVRGRRQEVTVVFIDIDDFTPLTERLEVGKMVELLNEFFSLVTEIVFRNQGIVDKFLGDAVMALFGAPTALPQSVELAVKAAKEVRAALQARAPDWQARFGETLRVSIGINHGEVIIGNIGSDRRLEYTAIGDTVNVAARLQSIAEANQILVGEEVQRRLENPLGVERLGEQALKGRDRKVTIYSVS